MRDTLRTGSLLVASVTLLSAAALAAPAAAADRCADADLPPSSETVKRIDDAVRCLVNVERKARGIRGLKRNRRLERSATFHSTDMATERYFAHERDGRPTLLERVLGYRYFEHAVTGLYAENLAVGPIETATARAVVHAWMLSREHKVTMLDARLREVGIAAVLAPPDPAFYPDYASAVYTADFGRRGGRRPRMCRRWSGDGASTARRPTRYCLE